MTRSAIVLAVCVVGALGGLWIGVMSAAFAGDASPSDFAMMGFMFWGAVGGTCVGASPGGIAAALMGKTWPWPLLGGAVGAVAAVVLEETPVFPADVNVRGPLYATCVIVGLAAGGAAWLLSRKPAAK